MIRHHVQKDAAAAVKYYQLADYLAEGEGPRAELGGRAAAMLGVAGSNDKLHFERLAHNLNPLTGEQLTERMRSDRIVGIDITFDGPKSFSVLEALTPDPMLAWARREASRETMLEMEEAAAARVRKGGKDENRTTGNLVWYRAEHDTTRPVGGVPDMQPHEHYFVLNQTWDAADRQWKAANLYDIIRDMPYYQAAYHARLASKLEELGYETERKGKAYFEVSGVPKSACAKFSRRKQMIDEEAKKRGITDAGEKAQLGARTREHKSDEFTPEQLRRIWAGKLSAAEQQAVAELHWMAKRAQAGSVCRPLQTDAAREAMEHAAAHVFERRSSAPAREVLAHALAFGVGKVTVEEAWARLEQGDRFTAAVDGRLHVASRAVLDEERKLVRLARGGKSALPAINPEWEIQDRRLETDQRAAVHHLLGSHDFVTMVQGAAGSGKTTLLDEARKGVEAAGLRVLAFAPTAQASRVNLAEAGFADAAPVAALLADPRLKEKARGQVILVDEAAMLGTKDAAALLKLARELDARLWLVGDDRQHRAVARGEPFGLLQRDAGLVPACVLRSRRQKSKGYKDAVELERKRPGRGLLKLKDMGLVKEVPDAGRHGVLAADYLEAVRPERKKVHGRWEEVAPTALVIAPTHAEGARVTEEIRGAIKARGGLRGEREFTSYTSLQLTEPQRGDRHAYKSGDVIQFTQNAKGHRRGERAEVTEGSPPPAHLAPLFQAYRPGTLRLAAGDRLRISLGGRTKEGHRLNNGDLLTVAGFTKAGDIIDARGWVIPKDYGHLTHGYVTTSVSGQSRTVDRVLVAAGRESLPAANARQMYVDLSRGREWARVYTHSAEELARAATRDDREVSATELAKLRKEQLRRGLLDRHLALLRRREAATPPQVDRQQGRALERGSSLER